MLADPRVVSERHPGATNKFRDERPQVHGFGGVHERRLEFWQMWAGLVAHLNVIALLFGRAQPRREARRHLVSPRVDRAVETHVVPGWPTRSAVRPYTGPGTRG